MTVLDIGGGRECPYYVFTKTAESHTFIALDIDENEIKHNQYCEKRVVADAASVYLPFTAASMDVVTSRSTIEHLYDNGAFLKNCQSVLRKGGHLISAFPCRYSPFAIVNKLLPDRLARHLLYYFHPEWRDVCGFKVYYDHCSYFAMRSLLSRHNFEIVHLELRYYQAIYYDFFIPLYLLMLFYDLMVWFFGIKALCCQMLFVARKVDDARTIGALSVANN
jgi:SAM-dependent methyltransferase